MGPRRCIFTNRQSKHKLEITKDKHSWTRAVPCSKAYLICRENRFYRNSLLKLELQIIESFYLLELNRVLLKTSNLFEDTLEAKTLQKAVLEIIGHEVERYEALNDEAFEQTLEAMLQTRLNALFTSSD